MVSWRHGRPLDHHGDRLLAELGLPLIVLRPTLWWFDLDDPALFALDRFPVFITESETGKIYGFPTDEHGRIKVAAHSGGEPADPQTVDRQTHPWEHQGVLGTARRVLKGVSNRLVESSACLYTMTPDTDLIPTLSLTDSQNHPTSLSVLVSRGMASSSRRLTVSG